MLTHQLMPRELVFAAAIAVPLGTVPNAVRLAALLMISSGEREALRLAVAPLALITVSSLPTGELPRALYDRHAGA